MIKHTLLRAWRWFRNPAYTGADRQPLLTGLSVGVGVAVGVVMSTVSIPAAFVSVTGAAVVILVRGYIFPGTPQLVSSGRHIANKARKRREADRPPLDGRDSGVAVTLRFQHELSPSEAEQLLISAGVIAPDDAGLHLTEPFRSDWLDRIQATRDDDRRTIALVTPMTDSDTSDIELSDQTDGDVGLTVDGKPIGRWASRAALSADLVVIPILTEWIPDWESLNNSNKVTLIGTLRQVLNVCPGCGRQLISARFGQTADSADGHVSVTCDQCGPAMISSAER